MDERTQGALLLAMGGMALRLGLTDAALAYVKEGLQPLLVGSGVVLIVLGLSTVLRAFRAADVEGATEPAGDLHGHHHDADHAHSPAVAWLLVGPLLALLLIAPPPLGSFAAARQSTQPTEPASISLGPLPTMEGGAVPLSLTEFTVRALYDETTSLEGVPVRLIGFVTPDEDDDYLLTRFSMTCCAADAQARTVGITGDQVRPADTWLEVEGQWEPRPGAEPGHPGGQAPLLVVDSVRVISEPAQPYEY
jgi:uncharacterized repeat protein (TIGR03943 family)